MNDLKIDFRLIDGNRAVADVRTDYVPFGVKVLKLQIRKTAGPAAKVWVRTRHFKRDQDPGAIYGYADDGEEDLIVVWGAGDTIGFCAKYDERVGEKKPMVLNDNESHVVYLHLIHRPRDPLTHTPAERSVTIVAVTQADDAKFRAGQPCDDLPHMTFTLTVPAEVPSADFTRPVWTARRDGSGSTIVLEGKQLARYVSRWWPSRQVEYAPAAAPLRITLDYDRTHADHEGAITIGLELAGTRQALARISGHLTLPIHDLRWFVPELYRFYDDRMYALRLWFFWINERIDADDLLSFAPGAPTEAQRTRADQEAKQLMQSRLWGHWPGWGKQYEIPDVERFDIIFDPEDLTLKYGCTDAHWREFWSQVSGNEPFHGAIAAPEEALAVVINHFLRELSRSGQVPTPESNPLAKGGLVAQITRDRCGYCYACERIIQAQVPATFPPVCARCGEPLQRPPLVKGGGSLGKNAPSIVNGVLLRHGWSNDVLEG